MDKKLYRSSTDKKVLGICGGLGEYFNQDPNLFRAAALVLLIVTGFIPFGIAYLACMLVIPDNPAAQQTYDQSQYQQPYYDPNQYQQPIYTPDPNQQQAPVNEQDNTPQQ